MKLKPIAQIRPELGVGLVTLGHKVKEVIKRVNLLTEEKETKMAKYDVPDLSPLERVDVLLEVVEKQAHGITDSLGKVNEKLLPSIEHTNSQLEKEKQPERAIPSGWLERKVCHLQRIQTLLCRVNEAAQRLRDTVVDRAVAKSSAKGN